MARPLDKYADVFLTCTQDKLAEDNEFLHLDAVRGIAQRTGPEGIAEADTDVVFSQDVKEPVVLGIERVFRTVAMDPFHDDGAAAAHRAPETVRMLEPFDGLLCDPAMKCQEIHALLAVSLDDLEHLVCRYVKNRLFPLLRDKRHFVQRDGTDRDRAFAQDRFPDCDKVACGGKVHDGVRAVFHGDTHLRQLFLYVGPGRRGADVGINFYPG